MRRVAAAGVALLVAFVALTGWALESGGVAVVETRGADGSPRRTHVWFAEEDGVLWLDAGTPENARYHDVQTEPALAFRADGRSELYRACLVEGEAAHREIRARMRRKYGIRDRWISLLFDTTRSVAVRLEPAEP